MSYNFVGSHVVFNDRARIYAGDVINLLTFPDNLPERCFLDKLEKQAKAALKSTHVCSCGTTPPVNSKFCNGCGVEFNYRTSTDVDIVDVGWSGEGSGYAIDFFEKEVAPKIKGFLRVVFIGEDGDVSHAYQITDGLVVKCHVNFQLTPKDALL